MENMFLHSDKVQMLPTILGTPSAFTRRNFETLPNMHLKQNHLALLQPTSNYHKIYTLLGVENAFVYNYKSLCFLIILGD